MKEKDKTLLKQANQAFRERRYQLALERYQEVTRTNPALASFISFNITLTQKRMESIANASLINSECSINHHKVPVIDESSLVIVSGLLCEDLNLYRSVSRDPFFYIEKYNLRDWPQGFYRLSLNIQSARKKSVSKLYVDYGQGFSEKNAFLLCSNNSDNLDRLLYFTGSVHALRFDPVEHEGTFEIKKFKLEFLENEYVIAELAEALLQKNISFGMLSFENVLHFYHLYNQTYDVDTTVFSYEEWIENVEAATLPSAEEARVLYDQLALKPLISVVMPTYNTDAVFLRACIDSVIAQSYPNWELCIADDASPKPHVRQILEAYAAQDGRIKTVFRDKNGHISRASNSALTLATGDYVALLDHDDALPEHALLFVAQSINAQPDAQVIYSDEDKIKADGQRFDPHFKSDWNPDLFYSQNYVSHLGVYKRDLLEKIGGFRPGVEGSQDYDLLLRCLPHVKAPQIVHIPRVLYHWRTVEGSTALAAGEKSYTTDAGIKALTDYFAKANPAVRIQQGLVPNTYRVRWPIPDPAPLVSLLIPTRDRRHLVEVAVRSILEKSTYTHYEILILDNGSVEPDTLAFFDQIQKEDQRVRVLRYDHPFNYSAINNFGVHQAKGEIIGLINNDIEVISPEWLTEMVSHAVRPEIGCVGAKLYYDNDTIQHAGVVLGIGGVAGHSHKYFSRSKFGYFSRLILTQSLSAVTAACLLVRKTVYEKVGGLDEEHLKVAFNDVDFCLKVRAAGYRNLWTPHAELYHYESISRGHEDTPEKQKRFQLEVETMKKRWGRSLEYDPYYSQNLTKNREDFSIGIA